MNILINAAGLHEGAGRRIAQQFLHQLAPIRVDDQLFLIASADAGYESLARYPNFHLLTLPESYKHSRFSQLWHLHWVFPRWCKRYKIDKVISLGNIAFPSKGRPQAVYLQLPQLAYHESAAWKLMNNRAFLKSSLADQFVALHLRYASSYAVPSEPMKRRLAARFRLPEERIHLLPHTAVSSDLPGSTTLPEPRTPLRLIFLSRYLPYKHFECLPALAQVIQEQQLPVEITLTLDRREGPAAAAILQAVSVFPFIRNVGPPAWQDVPQLIQDHHGVFLPSLMESLSGVYAEALQSRRLIFTSHYDFATSVLGDAAFYFDPLKPYNIATSFRLALERPDLVQEKMDHIELLARASAGPEELAQRFSQIIDRFD
jgi:hypothetical protein